MKDFNMLEKFILLNKRPALIKKKAVFYLMIILIITIMSVGVLSYYNAMNRIFVSFNDLFTSESIDTRHSDMNESIAHEVSGIMLHTTYFLSFAMLVFTILILYLVINHKIHSEKLYKLAYYNDVSGAPNLTKFKQDAESLLKRYSENSYAIIRFSIDKLSLLNEIYGYHVGDKILRCTSQALRRMTDGRNETYGNMYGDRFFILFECSSNEELTERRVDFEKFFYECMGNEIPHKIKFPSGWYRIEKNETDISAIIEKATFAHIIARQTRLANNEIQYYDDEMKKAALFENEIEDKMYKDLENGYFIMYLQPKYYIIDEKLAGAEALVKWYMNGALISPAMFIPVFEKNGFIVKLDMYMFEQACIFLRSILDMKKNAFKISVNFSRLHLSNKDYVLELCRIADKHKVPHNLLEIELTESVILEDQRVLSHMLDELHKNDFTLSIDDFGTGYSSLSLLKDIFVDVVKFDRSFLEASINSERALQIISSTIQMAKKLKIQVVAEGVETKEQLEVLRKMGCDIVQGYYYAVPMTADEFLSKFFNS